MRPNLANGWTSTLDWAITDVGTTVDVASTSGVPAYPFAAVILSEGVNTDEIVTVTNVSGNTLTLSRAVEPNSTGSSTASAHGLGATISHVLTARTAYNLASRGFNVQAYGAVGDGSTDDTAAINAAIVDLVNEGSGTLYFPAGLYKVTSGLTALSVPCQVVGDGAMNYDLSVPVTAIQCNSTTAVVFTVTVDNVQFYNLAIQNTAVGTVTAGAGIQVTGGTSPGDMARYDRLTISGFYINIDIQSGGMWQMVNCTLLSAWLYNVSYKYPALPDGGDASMTGCYLSDFVGHSGTANLHIESGGGIKIANCKFNGGVIGSSYNYGIELAVATNCETSQLQVVNCSFENMRSDAIHGTTSTAPSKWAAIQITNCQFGLWSNNSGKAVSLVATTASDFSAIAISNCSFMTSGTARVPMQFTKCDDITIGNLNLNGNFSTYSPAAYTTCTNVVSLDTRRGTAFPLSPATEDHFYRTDYESEFFWSGTYWLSTKEYALTMTILDALQPLSATGTLFYSAIDEVTGSTFLTRANINTYIASGGSGSAYWTIQFATYSPTLTVHNVGSSFNTSADTNAQYTKHTVTFNSVQTAGDIQIRANATKTSTVGNLYAVATVYYRLILT